jgi:nucleotide-binding universal stress UspA family protein
MKILIAYDGSECSRNALCDLQHAGLPPRAKAMILTVTESWSQFLNDQELGVTIGDSLTYRKKQLQKNMDDKAIENFEQAEQFAKAAGEILQNDFLHWVVQTRAVTDFPERGIIEEAKDYQPDLIVMGSHGRSAFGRFLLGSVSLKVLTEAPCSVRIARQSPARLSEDDSPTRVVIGIDGSPASLRAAEAVARRPWRQDGAARLVTAIEPHLPPTFRSGLHRAEETRNIAVRKLESAGLHVSQVTKVGAAKYVLVEEAARWGADSIFLGAGGLHWADRVLLGSVSYAVAARAECSVEVVRENLFSATGSELPYEMEV